MALKSRLPEVIAGIEGAVREAELAGAKLIADKAQEIARSKGLVRSGDLIRNIKPVALVRGAAVRSSSIHTHSYAYRYPRRLEYEDAGAGGYGPHATLLPAKEAKEPEVVALVAAAVRRSV